jgi:serine/threonine-protein kinase HipA
MKNKCLYCYEPIQKGTDFHEKCSKEFFGTAIPPEIPYSINQMTELAKNVVERSVTIPGVQAKISMSLIKETQKKRDYRLTVVGALGGNYILKPPSDNFPEMPQNEHLTMRIAEAYKLQVVPSSLIRLKSGELSYITKRVDRSSTNRKIHMLDMFQITEAFDKYKSSMEKLENAIHKYSENTLLDKIYLFELTLFCFLTGNNDMHLKNFSMIESSAGWILAPAYDLLNVSIILPEDKEELALTMEGKKKKLKKEHFEKFGARSELTQKQIERVFNRMIKHKSIAINWIDKSFLSDELKKKYKDNLEDRYMKLELV